MIKSAIILHLTTKNLMPNKQQQKSQQSAIRVFLGQRCLIILGYDIHFRAARNKNLIFATKQSSSIHQSPFTITDIHRHGYSNTRLN